MAAPSETVSELVQNLELVELTSERCECSANNLPILQKLTSLFREECHRETVDESVFQTLLQILVTALNEIELLSRDPKRSAHLTTRLQLTAECFRCLRNACVQCPRNQSIVRNIGLIDTAVLIIQLLHGLQGVQEAVLSNAFRCGLQFLGNAAAGNGESKDRIWKHAFPNLFLNYLNHDDEKAVVYCSMLLFTCFDTERLKDLQNHEKGLKVALSIVGVCRKQPELDWAILSVTDHLLKCPELVEAMYSRMSNQERIIFLELIVAKFGEKKLGMGADSKDPDVPLSLVEFLACCFQENCKAVLNFASDTNIGDEEALVVVRLLDCLCEMSSNHEEYESLQTCSGLLEDAVEILKQTHLIGKHSGNIFSVSHSLSGVEQVSHPAEGFKAHLIRLIGNLCYKNKENQDRVRKLDGIPLILDNCSIDDNNPFMNQWAVFAIRNLTEQNEENQEIIAKMEQLGLADVSALRSMGLDVQERDGTVLIKSLKKDQ